MTRFPAMQIEVQADGSLVLRPKPAQFRPWGLVMPAFVLANAVIWYGLVHLALDQVF